MTKNEVHDDLEHQQLVARCHALIAAIASRPGSIKLLKGVIPTLELFASYKANRARRRQRGSE